MPGTDAIARELYALLGTGRQVEPFSSRDPDFDLSQAYEVVEALRVLRQTRGETPVGRKIGFTNRAIWTNYNISGPIWNYMFDTTVRDLADAHHRFPVGNLPEPRIEPEIVFGLRAAPQSGMDERACLDCIEWVAHGFEFVYSIFPGWNFSAADAAAAYGVHAGLLIGARHPVSGETETWLSALAGFSVSLERDQVRREGHARNVLGGPISALKFLADELARFPVSHPLQAGEIVTTGTLTEAMPVSPGEEWHTAIECGGALQGEYVRLV